MMSKGLKSFILMALVAVVAGAAGAWGCASLMLRQQDNPGLHAIVHQELKLDAAQTASIRDIEARFADQRRTLEAEVRNANRELASAISASQGNSPAVQSAVDHFHVAMGNLQKATIAHVFEMRAVMTPEQAETFDARVVDTLLQEGGR